MQLPFYEKISNVRKDYDLIHVTKDNLKNAEVPRTYFGTKDSNRTMSMMASTAIRLTQDTIEAVGQIRYEEHPSLYMQQDSQTVGGCTSEQVLQREDCRTIVSLSSFSPYIPQRYL